MNSTSLPLTPEVLGQVLGIHVQFLKDRATGKVDISISYHEGHATAVWVNPSRRFALTT